MISMMVALVLGLLVSSAKSNFDATSAAITQGGAKVILLDRVLANYGRRPGRSVRTYANRSWPPSRCCGRKKPRWIRI